MIKLVINRREWLRGEGYKDSYLLRRSDNKKCCLGFAALQDGFTEAEISSARSPMSLGVIDMKGEILQRLITKPDWQNNELCSELMNTNDIVTMSSTQREDHITKLFKQIDIEVEFTN